jgi:hypothetical protein
MTKSESIKSLATALCAFQAEVEGAKRIAENDFYKRNGKNLKYADLREVWLTISKPLKDNGLSIVQTFTPSEPALVTIVDKGVYHDCNNMTVTIQTMLMHTSGEWIKSDGLRLPITKNDPQQMGSAITYGRRYDLTAFLGIYQEDDDANSHVVDPPKADPLKSVKDKAVKEIAAFNPTDQEINAIDLAKDRASIEAIYLTAKARFERQNTETEESIKSDIITKWNELKYPLKHQINSMQKHIAVDNLDACHDLGVLRGYREHLREEYRVSKEGK